ncbi:MAG TPA: D-alanyl-D-alanine carboxypeptidase [Papillibacter sp.]|jgi:D-alanyl-D-alanine carboxypeptidase|nr:D-alanyl-D-alanine carboxypeptidase [Papillibacter sp.]
MVKRVFSFFILLTLCAGARAGAVSAKAYALVEAETGRLITGANVSERLPMASTTKIMTGLLACESGRLDEEFVVPEEPLRVEGSSMGLVPGERITLRDLVYGLMLESGNDAANTIAYLLEGSIEAFAEKMNEKAENLGLENTHFDNPSGLDGPTHYTTALDLARLGAHAMQNEDFADIVSTWEKRVPYNGIQNGRRLVNHNALLKQYEGTLGIKTGFTKKSGRCLVSCAKRNGVTLVVATLKGPDDWNDHRSLLDYGFSVLRRTRLLRAKPDIQASIVGGVKDTIRCSFDEENLEASLSDKELPQVKTHILLRPFYYAAISKGQKLGEIVFTLDDVVLVSRPIYAAEPVEPISPSKLKGLLRSIFP